MFNSIQNVPTHVYPRSWIVPYSPMFLIKTKLPESCKLILTKLEDSGYEAYVVGGCIRDLLLNKEPNDWDIATNAKPGEMKIVLKDFKCFDTGIDHGTVTFLVENDSYEVTTFRIDGNYTDGRRPDNIEFSDNIEEDLSRRDFTINAMAYSLTKGFIDPFNGQDDLKAKVIRCVGNSFDRFSEDYLRVLRALRFAVILGFSIENDTCNAMIEHFPNLESISRERINAELLKLFSCDKSLTNHMVKYFDFYQYIFDTCFNMKYEEYCFYDMMNFDQQSIYHDRDLWAHTLDVLSLVPANPIVRFAAIFHDIGKLYVKTLGEDSHLHYLGHAEKSEEICRRILTDLHYSNKFIDSVCFLVLNHDRRPGLTKKSARKFIARCNNDLEVMENLLALMAADIACHEIHSSEIHRKELQTAIKLIQEVLDDNDCISLKDLNINGNDLLEIGFSKGPELGKCLDTLLDLVISDKLANNYECLKQKAFELHERDCLNG